MLTHSIGSRAPSSCVVSSVEPMLPQPAPPALPAHMTLFTSDKMLRSASAQAHVLSGSRLMKAPPCMNSTARSSRHSSRHTSITAAPHMQWQCAITPQHRTITSISASSNHSNGTGSSELQEHSRTGLSPVDSQTVTGSISTADVAFELQALKQQVSLLLEMAHISQQQNIQLQAQLTALTQGLSAATALPATSTSTAAATLSQKATSISSAKQETAAAAPSSVTPAAMSERAKTLSRLGFNAAMSGSFDSEEDENLHMLKGGIWRAEDPDPQEEVEQPPSPSRWAWAANRASPRVLRQGGRSEPQSIPRGRDTLDEENPQGRDTLDSHDDRATQSGQKEQQESGEVLRRSYDPDDALIANPFRGGVGESDAARERRVAPAARWDEASAGVEYVPPGRKEWNSQQRGKMEVERRAAAAVAAAAAATTAAAAHAQQVAAATPEYIAAADARQQREAEEARAWQEQEERVALQVAAELEAAAEKLAAAKLAAGRRAAADLAAADLALAQQRLASFQPAFPQVTEAEDREMFLREEEDGLKELQRHMQQWQQQSSAAAPALSVAHPSPPASAAAAVGPETIIAAPPTLVFNGDSPAVAEVDDEDDEFMRMMEEELNNLVPPASAAVSEAAATVRSTQSATTELSSTPAAAAPALVSPTAPALGNAASPLDLLMQELLNAELNSASVKGGGGSSSSNPPSRTSSTSKKSQSFPRRAVPQQAQQQQSQRLQQPEASATTPASTSIRIPLVTSQEAAAAISSIDVQGLSALEQLNLLPRVDKMLLTPGPPPARGEAVAAAAARPLATAVQRQGQRDNGRGGGGRGSDDRVKDDFRGSKPAPTEVLNPAAAAAAALLRGPPKSSRQRIASRSYGENGAPGGPTASAASTAI